MALVLTLLFLVLMSGLVLAFFSRAEINRKIVQSSTAATQAEYLADTAAELILSDFQGEIAAGSDELSNAGLGENATRIFRPKVSNAGDLSNNPATSATPIADSMLPGRMVPGKIAGLFKGSYPGQAFFAGGPLRVSDVLTSSASLSGRFLMPEQWLRPKLMSASEEALFLSGSDYVPRWIYIDRKGASPTNFSPETLREASDPRVGNANYVIGRFAYLIYEVGGLLNANVVGNTLDQSMNLRKGRIHQVNLANALPGMDASSAAAFVGGWRWPVSGGDTNALFDSQRDFLKVIPGDQAFVGRQDLIRFAERSGSPIAVNNLHRLTHFSRSLNAPHWEPSPWRPKEDEDLADAINPGLLSTRFASETTLDRGDDADVTVSAGTPVMPRRFPMNKLAMLAESAPDTDTLRYYFGVERKGDQTWEYVSGIDVTDPNDGSYQGTRIARLDEVAQLGREPNFFEILQAVIATDSLGKAGGDSQSKDQQKDGLRNLQVLRIGANIIDQWDADNIPTIVRYPSGFASELVEVYGTENLPYISQIGVVPHRPEYNRNLFQIWGLFDVWNPHQNATELPGDIAEFRIVPVSGRALAGFWYTLYQDYSSYYQPMYVASPPNGGRDYIPYATIKDLNSLPGRELTFSASQTYEEPTTIRGGSQPTQAGDFPGLLLVEEDVVAAGRDPIIPAKPNRTAAMQRILNGIIDLVMPYTVPNPPGYSDDPATGDRIYPAGTSFTGFHPAAWTAVPPLPPPLGGGTAQVAVNQTRVYANYGIKTANQTFLYPDADNPLTFELQARVNGIWRTYQRFEDFNFRSGFFLNRADKLIGTSPQDILNRLLESTYHSAPSPNLTECFHPWRGQGVIDNGGGTVDSWIKFDPRSRRWGASRVLRDALGNSPHSTDVPYDYSEDVTRWVVTRENPKTGLAFPGPQETFGDYGFEFMRRPGNPSLPPLFTAWGGAATNNPDLDWPNSEHPLRYRDRDGVIRPADGYWGTRPTVRGRIAQRSVILNRPFRSVGELGYAFRDLPWKTMDFASRFSADLGLLDVFSLDESIGKSPVVAGSVNLNTATRETLEAVLKKSLLREKEESSLMTDQEAAALAKAIVDNRDAEGPFMYVSDIIPRVFNPQGGGGALAAQTSKEAREAGVRTLGALTSTRTWNFLIDLVLQSGKLPGSVASPDKFVVRAERHLWIHVAIDRITGEILELQKETVYE